MNATFWQSNQVQLPKYLNDKEKSCEDMLEAAFAKLNNCNCHTLPVTRNGRLVGLLTMDNLGEFMRIQTALSN